MKHKMIINTKPRKKKQIFIYNSHNHSTTKSLDHKRETQKREAYLAGNRIKLIKAANFQRGTQEQRKKSKPQQEQSNRKHKQREI